MDSQTSRSIDIAVANRRQSTVDKVKNSPQKKVSFRNNVIATFGLTTTDEDEDTERITPENNSSQNWQNRNQDDALKKCGTSFKLYLHQSQALRNPKPSFPSDPRAFHGIQHGGPYHRRRRDRDWCKFSARCVSRISNRKGASGRVLRGRCSSYRKRYRSDNFAWGTTGFKQLFQRSTASSTGEAKESAGINNIAVQSLSTSQQTSRKRRVGIVENHYVAGNGDASPSSSVCDLVRGLERLLAENSTDNGVTMKSKKQQEKSLAVEEEEEEEVVESVVDPSEENETYDEFDTIRMPVVRALSKSPQSDEGIETDTERRRGSVARCWSLDSAAASDEDTSLTGHQQKRHKLRVTRCCSSDSAVLSDEDQNKGWDNSNMVEGGETEHNEGRPRYWRTPSVVVSDYSDYSYLDEKLERSDLDLEKYDGTSGTPSQASSCSCLDCDEIRESLDNQFLQVCRHRRHSDSCCLCLDSTNPATLRNFNEAGNRRNSCLDSGAFYSKFDPQFLQYSQDSSNEAGEKRKIELLNIPPARKISDCSTTSSLSGDECDVTELQRVKSVRSSGWRKLRNIVHWTPFFQTYKKQRYPWVQLGGHQGNFRAGPTPGTILKKLCPQEEACFRLLMNDVLRPYVPEFKGVLDVRETEEGNAEEADGGETQQKEATTGDAASKRTIVSSYLQLQDLLGDFEHPCVMDCKVGVRTYLESELAKAKERPKLRKDMYEKMVQVDPTAPNAEERRVQGITKPRYMVWRETISSTATLGFRVEGIKLAHGGSSKDFKTTRTREQVTEALSRFVEGYPHVIPKYLQRLKAIRTTLKASPFFASHEVVGSSLLFVHDAKNAGIWMIDFAKTLPLPQHLPRIRHDSEWQVGNHEDGYLIGVNNLIEIFEDIRNSKT